MFEAVIFDLDGTTADTLDDLASAMNTMLSHYGYPQRSREEISIYLGRGQRYFVECSLPENARDSENIDTCMAYYESYYAENTINLTKEYDGISDLFRRLGEKGIKRVIFSNKNHSHVDKIVRGLFDLSLLDMVVGAGKVKHKPDPEGMLFIAEKLGVSPERCAFVGDTEIDIQTAKNAGAFSVGVLWGFRTRDVLEQSGADAIASSVGELCEILGV